MRTRALAMVCLAAAAASADAQSPVSGVVETYFTNTRQADGFVHALSWFEFSAPLDDRTSVTFSGTDYTRGRTYDEAQVSFQLPSALVRVGRLRTNFGISDWSDLFYNGFNQRPLVRTIALVDSLRLLRNDSGVEVTFGGPDLQVTTALLDPEVTSFQIGPDRARAGMVRLQRQQGSAILGVEALDYLNDDRAIYGADLRWSSPRWIVRSEYFKGDGGHRNAQGSYTDVSYRVPNLPRTQIVARSERMDLAKADFQHYTLGVRQLVGDKFGINLNYAWSEGRVPASIGARMQPGWGIQATCRVAF